MRLNKFIFIRVSIFSKYNNSHITYIKASSDLHGDDDEALKNLLLSTNNLFMFLTSQVYKFGSKNVAKFFLWSDDFMLTDALI